MKVELDDQFAALRISDVDTLEALAFEVAAPLVEWALKCCVSIPAQAMIALSQLPIMQGLTGLCGRRVATNGGFLLPPLCLTSFDLFS